MDTVHFCISLRLNFFDMFNFHDACKPQFCLLQLPMFAL